MWNFTNGQRMPTSFEKRNREVCPILACAIKAGVCLTRFSGPQVTALLFLPKSLHCLVGIGWTKKVTRWPDPGEKKKARP